MSRAPRAPHDQAVRDRLLREFDRNFLVQAGAGSGKTHSLATRMAAGIAAGTYAVEQMAVVTFTRKAAAELRGRFQLALEQRLAAAASPDEKQRLETALAGMERLFAGTIHSFCAHLLRERPVDARVAPGFEELSDIDNVQRQRAAWREFVTEARASSFTPMIALLDAGIRPGDLYDPFKIVCEHEDVEFDMGAGEMPDPRPAWAAADAFWSQLLAFKPPAFHPETTCKLQQQFGDLEWLHQRKRDRPSTLADFLARWEKISITQKYWAKEVGRDQAVGRQVKALIEAFQAETVAPFLQQWRAYVHRLSMTVLVQARDYYAEARRRQNVVNYVDLLRVTAGLLKSGPRVRRALQRKYRWLFVDEFQDTDPIQAEIFLLLAADEPEPHSGDTEPSTEPLDPFTLPLRPGALFVVGDPKQSIYRFRRADIDIYNRVGERIRQTGGEILGLTANFRSLPGVCALANTVFPPLFANECAPYSPAFEPLNPVRDEAELATAPRIAKLLLPPAENGDEPAEAEAARIAAYIQAEVRSGRRSYGDFLVLTRQTPRLSVFAGAFDAAEVPVDVSGAGLFTNAEEVRVLAALLASLADPLDSVALVGVLRGPLFGLSDADLYRYRSAGSPFDLLVPIDAGSCSPVVEAMRRLQEMWRSTRRLPLAAAVERILEDTGWLALAATTPGGAPAGRLLQAIDRVREVAEKGGGLAEAADALNEEDASSEAEALPLEPGRRDVVRLMNLHKAKGLEAPVVFLADATHAYDFPIVLRVTRDQGVARGHLKVVRGADEPWKRVTLGEPIGWAAHEEEEQRYCAAEKLRLLYVAGTRAKELLVVCRCGKAAKNKAWGEFEGYLEAMPELVLSAPIAEPALEVAAVDSAAFCDARETDASARRDRHDIVTEPSWAVSTVTGEKARLAVAERAKRAAEPGAEILVAEATATAGHRADAGAAWGSLVHGLLEHAMQHPPATRADLERLARWLTVETPDLRPYIPEALDLVEAVREAPFWKDAREGGAAHVEVPFAVRLEPGESFGEEYPVRVPTLLHGVIDLVYRAANGWRIIDYKTDIAATDETVLAERYGPQVVQYRLAWERATGTSVSGTGLVALRTLRVLWRENP